MSGETWNLLRHGEVVAVDTTTCCVKVHFEELNDTSDWLPVLQIGGGGLAAYWLPSIGAVVVAVFFSDATEEGVVLGSLYTDEDNISDAGSGVYYVKFPDGSSVKWDNGALEIIANSVDITGGTTITGNVIVHGTVTAQHFIQEG
ncbi:MAG: phage baseplate assembly protein V [Armatimonadota bacterium]|nr:phage baseplate assembly protein V [bacterium]